MTGDIRMTLSKFSIDFHEPFSDFREKRLTSTEIILYFPEMATD